MNIRLPDSRRSRPRIDTFEVEPAGDPKPGEKMEDLGLHYF